jgi:hypothetical protein
MSWTKTADATDPDSLPGMAQQLRLIADQLDSAPNKQGVFVNLSKEDVSGIINELEKISEVLGGLVRR